MIKTMPGRGYLLAVAAAPVPDGIGEFARLGGHLYPGAARYPARRERRWEPAQVWPRKSGEEKYKGTTGSLRHGFRQQSKRKCLHLYSRSCRREPPHILAGCVVLMAAVFEVGT